MSKGTRMSMPPGRGHPGAQGLLSDLADMDGIASAKLARRPAAAGERGIVEEIGKLVVTVTTSGAAEALIGLLKSLLPQGAEREIVVKLPNGTEFALKGGGVSEAQFAKATDALLALLAGSAGDETA